ncbi:MAG: hypothetical protein E6H72_02665 [Betaproteobacteria bacterium]|nr:MAG: hypothetical protein E6H72_02665 [Betaproteobacteria bacterium]
MRIATLMVVLLAGCATSGGELTEARDSWDGATYDEVVLRWGTPARSTKLSDGRDVYTWVSESVGSRGSVHPSIGISAGSGGGIGIGTGIMFGSGGGEPVRCERTLIFKAGRVDEQTWEGPAGYCRSFGRSAR